MRGVVDRDPNRLRLSGGWRHLRRETMTVGLLQEQPQLPIRFGDFEILQQLGCTQENRAFAKQTGIVVMGNEGCHRLLYFPGRAPSDALENPQRTPGDEEWLPCTLVLRAQSWRWPLTLSSPAARLAPMMGREAMEAPGAVAQPLFATTHWSVVLASADQDSPQAAAALEQLCRTYWYPLYVYVRRRGYVAEDAQDLTQEFFALLLRKDYFRLADPRRGKFRTFLLHAFEHFVINEWKHAQRAKRGGGATFLSLDAEQTEQRYAKEPATAMTPERAYEKRWAITLLDRVLALLREEYARAAKERLFDELASLLWGKDTSSNSGSCAAVGQRLGMTEAAVRVALHRLRKRYGELLRTEIAQTVASPAEVDEELKYLLGVVSSSH